MKKIIAVALCVFMLGCATTSNDFFGAKIVSPMVPRGKGYCAMVEGWNINEVTNKNTNCLCSLTMANVDVVNTQQSLELMGFAPAAVFMLVPDYLCDSAYTVPGQ